MEKRSLMHGVEHDGVVHYDYTVRMPVVRDTMEALRLTDEAYGATEGPAAGMYYRVALMALAMTSLGTLSADEITPELLADNLSDDDFDLIDAEMSAIKKKRMDARNSSADTALPSLPSGAAVLPNSA
ncbi:hypothetical protein EHW64_13585 [Erwinia psidii]|uniref:hypothetical protein n=1 Tax=Erwinia psidii TaxID=69224 RepID=UPI00226BB999|nr:hypothetical protein [Erwinia psidii]MCX8962134.1 hypothetical protein [Erwinia psidii]